MSSKTKTYIIVGVVVAIVLFGIVSFFLLRDSKAAFAGTAAVAAVTALAARASVQRERVLNNLQEVVKSMEEENKVLEEEHQKLLAASAEIESSVKDMTPDEKVALGNNLLKPKDPA